MKNDGYIEKYFRENKIWWKGYNVNGKINGYQEKYFWSQFNSTKMIILFHL